jgi:hypothetical protein
MIAYLFVPQRDGDISSSVRDNENKMTKYRISTYKSILNKYEIIDLVDAAYGEWIIYQNRTPIFHVNLANEKNDSVKIIKEKISNSKTTIKNILETINVKYKTNLHLEKKDKFAIKVNSKMKELNLNSIPIQLLNSSALDLNSHKSKIEKFILKATNDFKIQHKGIKSIGIYTSPINGWISMNFNLTENLGSTDYNCPDFEFVEYDLLSLKSWELEYESKNPTVINTRGELIILKGNFSDEEFNKIFFEFLKTIIETISEKLNGNEIYLQILDSKFEKHYK